MTPEPEMLTIGEAASKLGVGGNHVTRLISKGELDAIDVAIGKRKKSMRISRSSVSEFVARRRVSPSAGRPATTRRPSLPSGVLPLCG